MNRKSFLKLLPFSALLTSFKVNSTKKERMRIRLLRHASLVIEIGGKKLLIDPMLSPKDAMDPVSNCGNDTRIPMVDLPVNEKVLTQLLKDVDAVFVTHTHRDHWDAVAESRIDKSKTIFCQPADVETLENQGFGTVISVEDSFQFEQIKITRTGGQHGTGEIGKRMGIVSGFVLHLGGNKIYIAGDTVWCDDVESALRLHNPDVIVLNAGGAKFLTGDPITMTPDDVLRVRRKSPESKIIAVHMDTVNHCFARRTDLRKAVAESGLKEILIPEDGETIEL